MGAAARVTELKGVALRALRAVSSQYREGGVPYMVVVNGVTREFEFFAPPGWEYFVEELYTEEGRDGLPLLVMLHGGGQSIDALKSEWPFGAIPLGDSVDILDRFFVLIPYGTSYFDVSGTPVRSWNYGYSPHLADVDDAAFVAAAITLVKGWLDTRLTALGSARASIDTSRQFLFGYSAGGMMAYKLAAEQGDTWAAMWVQSASFGGRVCSGYTALVENSPAGTSPVALFVHHGDDDLTVLPGTLGAVSQENVSTTAVSALDLQGLTSPDKEDFAKPDRSLAGATDAFKTLNSLQTSPYSDTTNNPDRDGGNTSRRREWRNAASDDHPVVVLYRDPEMNHTNFTSAGVNRYFDETDVWAWFKSQTP